MKKIENFMLPEHFNRLYTNEAVSSFALTREVANKINELVDAYNQLSSDDLVWKQEQDGRVRKAVLYMKDNLLNSLNDLMETLRDSGFIDDRIEYHCDNLKQRLDNLLGSVTTGTTSLDAEIIDMRLGADDVTYRNAGEALRNQLKNAVFVGVSNYKTVLPDLDEATAPRYFLNFATTETSLPENLPFDSVPEPICLLENFTHGNYGFQILTAKGKIYTRYRGGTTWQSWRDESLVNTLISASNYETILPDLNAAKEPEYLFLFSTGTTSDSLPLNMPFDEMPFVMGILKNYFCGQYIWQEFNIYGTMYNRLYNGSAWTNWTDGSKEKYLTVNAGNYETRMPDADACEDDFTYIINFAIGSTDMPENLPFTAIPDSLLFLETHKSGSYGYQEVKPANNKYLYRRMYAGGWQGWFLVYGNTTEGESSLSVTPTDTILAGLKRCYESGYKKLIVESGEYDIIAEYEKYYGSDYFTNYENYSTSDRFDRGLWLEDIEIIFSPGAKVVCHYTGDNENVSNYFSPFSCGNNVIIDGLVLDASGCRYGIHPDFNTGTARSYMTIRNSDLKHFKSNTNEQCIGAGFGMHVDWLIENTIFRSENENIVFRVHNNVAAGAQSKLVVKDCYIDGTGYFKFNHYSTSEKLSTIIVCGCSYITEPVTAFETSDSTIENMKLIKYNNEVRTS